MMYHNISDIDKTVKAAIDAGYEEELKTRIKMATAFRKQLIKINKLKDSVVKLDTSTMSELKAYKNPPPVVYEVMKATFLLLGEDEYYLEVIITCFYNIHHLSYKMS